MKIALNSWASVVQRAPLERDFAANLQITWRTIARRRPTRQSVNSIVRCQRIFRLLEMSKKRKMSKKRRKWRQLARRSPSQQPAPQLARRSPLFQPPQQALHQSLNRRTHMTPTTTATVMGFQTRMMRSRTTPTSGKILIKMALGTMLTKTGMETAGPMIRIVILITPRSLMTLIPTEMVCQIASMPSLLTQARAWTAMGMVWAIMQTLIPMTARASRTHAQKTRMRSMAP
mmetsp:Transcript_59244/g.114354  ORF Transcript_59244/g.114354 Transcript_59244/m.114354 type:complete len:231 (+) Transcript_59244:533-1225(+)